MSDFYETHKPHGDDASHLKWAFDDLQEIADWRDVVEYGADLPYSDRYQLYDFGTMARLSRAARIVISTCEPRLRSLKTELEVASEDNESYLQRIVDLTRTNDTQAKTIVALEEQKHALELELESRLTGETESLNEKMGYQEANEILLRGMRDTLDTLRSVQHYGAGAKPIEDAKTRLQTTVTQARDVLPVKHNDDAEISPDEEDEIDGQASA
jgi:hypothetical protein